MARTVAVFCGSRPGRDPAYAAAARDMGEGLAKAGVTLVYGGGRVGLMGVMADAALAAGGCVIGVIPEFLVRREVAHPGLTERITVTTMHARKQVMAERADVFAVLPGGLGTLDETIEILTWRMLGLHDKKVVVCDAGGWAGPFLAAVDAAVAQDFAYAGVRNGIVVARDVSATLSACGVARDFGGGYSARSAGV